MYKYSRPKITESLRICLHERGDLVNGVSDRKAERCHVARSEVDSDAPDTVGLQER